VRVIVVDDAVAAEDSLALALAATAPAGGGLAHQVMGVRSPRELRQILAVDRGFDLAMVDMDFGPGSPETGLVALRLLDETGIPCVVWCADIDENRGLLLLAAFHYFEPWALASKAGPIADVIRLVEAMEQGLRPGRGLAERYRPARGGGQSLLERLVGNATQLDIWRALTVFSSRPEVAARAGVAEGTLDRFLQERYAPMREAEHRLVGVSPGRETETVAGNRARIAPLHAFAVRHANFFRDQELERIVRSRYRRAAGPATGAGER
jgi:hypothetical protein